MRVSIEPIHMSFVLPTLILSAADPIASLGTLLDIQLQKRRERGRVSLKGVRLVEAAVLNNEGAEPTAPDVSCNILLLISY